MLFTVVLCAVLGDGPAFDTPNGKPALIARPVFHLVVEKEPRLAAGDRPDASAPAGDGRLSVTIRPERKQFPANGPVSMTVTLKNVSDKPLQLFRLDRLGARPELVCMHLKTAGQVRVGAVDVPAAPEDPGTSVLLEPGKSVVRTAVVEVQPRFFAPPPGGPVPLPGPVPRERDAAAAPDRRRPAPWGVAPNLLPEGTVRLRLTLEFSAPNEVRGGAAHWTGKLSSEPVDVELSRPAVVPPVVPPLGPPTTREQAIRVAHRAAEAALTAAYDPVDPVRPPHVGDWIADPAAAATVKDRAGGGWTISWTHTSKGKGHSHHVVIDVPTAGGATVREVFAGYSNR